MRARSAENARGAAADGRMDEAKASRRSLKRRTRGAAQRRPATASRPRGASGHSGRAGHGSGGAGAGQRLRPNIPKLTLAGKSGRRSLRSSPGHLARAFPRCKAANPRGGPADGARAARGAPSLLGPRPAVLPGWESAHLGGDSGDELRAARRRCVYGARRDCVAERAQEGQVDLRSEELLTCGGVGNSGAWQPPTEAPRGSRAPRAIAHPSGRAAGHL